MSDGTAWGRLPHEAQTLLPLNDPLQALSRIQGGSGLPHGAGRSYGDVGLNPGGSLWLTRGLDRFIAFDETTGVLHCEAGVLLRDIQRAMLPRGWALPVTPGTQIVTVGGAIANDVHGKNHHEQGCFGHHVLALRLARTDGQVILCGPQQQTDWFGATVGGLGLTGVILDAKLQLRRIDGPWVDCETIAFGGLDEFFALSEASEPAWEYTVAWIDCIWDGGGRGIFERARRVRDQRPEPGPARERRMPLVPPFSLVNSLSLRAFNLAYFNLQRWRAGTRRMLMEPFHHPLDALHDWNRMYGPRGFYQYQCVVPRAPGPQAVRALLDAISASGEGSFLAVLKTFGMRESLGLLSFARPGVTLALDFPNRGERSLRLFERLDAIVAEAGGAIYMAKDARMPRSLYESGYPAWPGFLPYRDPGISSGLSRRLMGS